MDESTRTDDERPVASLSFVEASLELDGIVAFFEQREVDVDQLVARLERATAIVAELDARLRRTRARVEELVPQLQAAASGEREEQIVEVEVAGATNADPTESDEELERRAASFADDETQGEPYDRDSPDPQGLF
jgi:exodeoxyribonuclease VII small subunit